MKLIALLCLWLFPFFSWATERPAALIHTERLNTTVFLVDKSECSVSVFRYHQQWEKVYTFGCTSGKVEGNKFSEGDMKTPTGLYWFSNAWTDQMLFKDYGNAAKIYGVGAFALNYPNYLDTVLYQKSGHGIWLHGTDQPQPIATRGCISTSNDDLLKLAQYIELHHTPIIIEEKVSYLPEEKISEIGKQIAALIEEWRRTWESDQTDEYLKLYSPEFKTERFNYRQWIPYKQRVNGLNKNREVVVRDLSIFKADDIYTTHFVQQYTSSRINTTGRKFLYLKDYEGSLKIVSERWEPLSYRDPKNFPQFAYKSPQKNPL